MCHVESFRTGSLTIPVHIRGRAAKPLLFLPGLGVHPRHYGPALDRLARRFTVVTPDLSFGSNAVLPTRYADYLDCIDAVARRFAPDAPRVGHSLGGLLALQGTRPAVALSPLVPVRLGWPAQLWRAVRLQVREYAGFEGATGIRWALAMLVEYAATAPTAPGKLFPVVAETRSGDMEDFLPSAPSLRLVLGRRDPLYHRGDYASFVERADLPRDTIRWLPHGHDWPVTRPALVESEVLAGLRRSAPGRDPAENPLAVSPGTGPD